MIAASTLPSLELTVFQLTRQTANWLIERYLNLTAHLKAVITLCYLIMTDFKL